MLIKRPHAAKAKSSGEIKTSVSNSSAALLMTAALDSILHFEDVLAEKINQLLTLVQKHGLKTFSIITKTNQTGLILLGLGVMLFLFPTVYKSIGKLKIPPYFQSSVIVNQPAKNSPAIITGSNPIKINQNLLSEKEPSQPPSKIIIPSLNIDLPIVEAKVINGFWEISQTSASHGIGSANPGEIGNTIIFAHAREGLFGPLKDIKQGTKVYLLTKDRWYFYSVKEIKMVDPSQIEEISQTPDETLTLYTCSGFLDSKRLIAKAKRI